MKFTAKLFLALAFVASFVLTSCKDDNEDNYQNAIAKTIDLSGLLAKVDDMQKKIDNLEVRVLNGCGCKVTQNADGTITVETCSGQKATSQKVDFLKDANGNPIGIVIGDQASKFLNDDALNDAGFKTDANGNVIGFTIPGKEDIDLNDLLDIKNQKVSFVKEGAKIVGVKIGEETYGVKYLYSEDNKLIIGMEINGEKHYFTECGCKFILDDKGNLIGLQQDDVKHYLKEYVDFIYEDNDPAKKVVGIKVGQKEYQFSEGSALVVEFVKDDKEDPKKITGIKIGEEIEHFATASELAELVKKVETLQGVVGDEKAGLVKDVKDLQERMETAEGNIEDIQDDINEINETLEDLQDQIDEITERLDAIEKTIAKLVTGITIQQVYNPAFGSYNSVISNVQTDMLIGYFNYYDQPIQFFDYAYDPVKSMGTLIDDREGNAGKIYLTVNPNTVDFTGLDLQLVNSNDDASGIILGKLKKSYDLLHFGYTRSAADNGFYEIPANLTLKGLGTDKTLDVVGNMNIDKTQIINDVKAFVREQNKTAAKPVLKDLAKVSFDAARSLNKLQALGVKCSYKELDTEKSIYSNYNIAAAAVKPLGFNTADDIFKEGGSYWRGYDKAKQMVTKVTKKVAKKAVDEFDKQFMLGNLSGDIEDVLLKIDTIDHVKVPEDAMKFVYQLDTTMTLKFKAETSIDMSQALAEKTICTKYAVEDGKLVEKEWTTLKYLADESKIAVDATVRAPEEGEEGVTEYTVRFKKTIEIDMTARFTDIINQINEGFDDTNDLIGALEKLLEDANDMLAHIKKLEQRVKDAKFLDRVWNYTDKIANKVGKYGPYLFKPTLFINSDNGFGICGFRGAVSQAKGTVTVVPTTYSAEIVAPILRKAIKVNGTVVTVDGKKALDGNVKSVDITSYLNAGANKIQLYAVDFYGKSVEEEYIINYTK